MQHPLRRVEQDATVARQRPWRGAQHAHAHARVHVRGHEVSSWAEQAGRNRRKAADIFYPVAGVLTGVLAIASKVSSKAK